MLTVIEMAWKVATLCIVLSYCRASDSCSNGCTGKIDLQSHSEESVLNAVKCHSWCTKQYNVELPVTTTYSVWPTLNITALETDCHIYQKVEQCREGCRIKLEDSSKSVIACRTECFSKCEATCEETCMIPFSHCNRKCGKTFCRKGCSIPEGAGEDSGTIDALSPLSEPVLTRVPETMDYMVTIPERGIPSVPSNGSLMSAIHFIFKVIDVDDNVTVFYWQTDLSRPLKLIAFTCRSVEISFAVVGGSGMSSYYSPPNKLCVHPVIRHPAPVDKDTISLRYDEDMRQEYLGYSQVTVSWSRPRDYEYLEWYSIHVLSGSTECGGKDNVYSYKIPKNATSWTLVATEINGYLKYGCSYKLRIEAHPTNYDINNQITFEPQDNSIPPSINVTCETVNRTDVLVRWTISNATNKVNIEKFAIITHDSVNFVPQEKGNSIYSYMLSNLTVGVQLIKLRSLQSGKYYWRPVPNERTCSVYIGNVTNNTNTNPNTSSTNATVNSDSSSDNRTISVYYKDSSTRSKIFELKCTDFKQERLSLNTNETVIARIAALEDKIDDLLSLLTNK